MTVHTPIPDSTLCMCLSTRPTAPAGSWGGHPHPQFLQQAVGVLGQALPAWGTQAGGTRLRSGQLAHTVRGQHLTDRETGLPGRLVAWASATWPSRMTGLGGILPTVPSLAPQSLTHHCRCRGARWAGWAGTRARAGGWHCPRGRPQSGRLPPDGQWAHQGGTEPHHSSSHSPTRDP